MSNEQLSRLLSKIKSNKEEETVDEKPKPKPKPEPVEEEVEEETPEETEEVEEEDTEEEDVEEDGESDEDADEGEEDEGDDEEPAEEDVNSKDWKKVEKSKPIPATDTSPIEKEVAILQNDGIFRRELIITLKELVQVHKVNTEALLILKSEICGEDNDKKETK